MDNLLPCPFCGSIPTVEHIGSNKTKVRKIIIRCQNCGVQRTNESIHHDFGRLEEYAKDNWNERWIN